MKVAFVVHQYPPRYSTGTEIYAHRLARVLREWGHDVRVFTQEPDPRQATTWRLVEDRVDDVPVTRFTFFDGLVPNHVLHDYYSVFLGKILGRWLDDVRPDVVHAFHLMGPGLSVVEEARARGLPVFVQLMDYWFLCPTVQLLRHDGSICPGPETAVCLECLSANDYGYQVMRTFARSPGFAEGPGPDDHLVDLNAPGHASLRAALTARPAFIRGVLEGATGLVAPSLFIRTVFARHGYPVERMIHVPYGVDPPAGRVKPIPVGGRDRVTFGFFGSVNAQKGLEILVTAFTQVRGERLRLVVRGNMTHFPKYARRVRALAETDPRVLFKGPYGHGELADALSAIDVLVVPSVWYENTPFVVLEAFSAGRPVVASDLGGLAELVQDGRNGRTFRAGDPGHLMDVLEDFRDDPDLLGRLAGGIREVRTLQENARDFVELWDGALAAGRSA